MENKSLFEKKQPSNGLKTILKYTKKGNALDIGAGKGIDSIFLAEKGFIVDALDKNAEGLKELSLYSKKNNLPIKINATDVRKFRFPKERYSLIVAITSLDFLRLLELKRILAVIKKSLTKEGILYLAVFSTKDPSFKISKKSGFKMIEKNTFYFPKIKMVRHYFQRSELLELLKDFKILKFEEVYKKNIPKEVHSHNLFRIIVRK